MWDRWEPWRAGGHWFEGLEWLCNLHRPPRLDGAWSHSALQRWFAHRNDLQIAQGDGNGARTICNQHLVLDQVPRDELMIAMSRTGGGDGTWSCRLGPRLGQRRMSMCGFEGEQLSGLAIVLFGRALFVRLRVPQGTR